MKRKVKRGVAKLGCAAAGTLLVAATAGATTVSYDEITYQNGTGVVPGSLSGQVDMFLSGNVLTVDLKNTSALMPGLTSGGLAELAGIAFNLPSGVGISGGSAAAASGSTVFNDGGTMNNQWGYSRASSGNLSGGAFAFFGLTYNADAATLVSDTTASFAGPPASQVDGLNYGAISAAQKAGGTVPGHPYVVDTIELKFNLTGTVPGNLISLIDAGSIGLMFGSPDTGPGGSAPDGGATLALLGVGLVGVETLRRKLRKA